MATKPAKTAKKPTKTTKTTKAAVDTKKATAAPVAKMVKPVAAKKSVADATGYGGLRKWNIRLAIVLIAEAVAVVIAGGSQTVPITMQYLSVDSLASDAAGHQVLALATRHIMDVHLSWVVAKFLLIFAVVYLLAGTLWRRKYEAWLGHGVNKLRWVAFGVGGGVMATAVAMLSGVADIVYLLLIFGAVFASGMTALALDLLGPDRRLKRLLVGTGVVMAALPWGVVISSLVGAWLRGGTLPTFVYYVYLSMFLMVIAVGLGCYFRGKMGGKWASTVYTEKMFMLLGFIAASVLAWQIFAGALQS